MFQNALKTTLRNFGKHKGYSFLNIAGLSVGLGLFILILLFVGYEFRYEKHHRNADRIYRLIIEQNLGTGSSRHLHLRSRSPKPSRENSPRSRNSPVSSPGVGPSSPNSRSPSS